MKLNVTALPGDGIGPEVTREAVKVLRAVSERFLHELVVQERPIGGIALDETGSPLPDSTLEACLSGDAVLLGAVGGPRYENNPRGSKPEDGLLRLRRELKA